MFKKWLLFAAKLAVSVLLIWLIATNFEIGDVADRFTRINYWHVLSAFTVFLILVVNNTARWYVVLSAIHADLKFLTAMKILYIGYFFNQTLPSAVGGDAVRMYLTRKEGASLQGAINGVMLERVATVSGLILLVVATQPLLLARVGDSPAKYVFPGMAAAAVLGICMLMLLDRFPEHLRQWKIIRGIGHLAADTKKLFLSPYHAAKAIGLGVTGNIMIAFMAYSCGLALGVQVSILDCLVLIPPVTLIMTLPISIAGWGVREGAMVAAFAFVGVAEGDAFVMSIMFGLVNIFFVIPGGLIWLIGGNRGKDIADSGEMPVAS